MKNQMGPAFKLSNNKNNNNTNKGTAKSDRVNDDDYKCKVCQEVFPDLKTCLRHELLTHNGMTSKRSRSKFHNFIKLFNHHVKKSELEQLHRALSECTEDTKNESSSDTPGEPYHCPVLDIIFREFCATPEYIKNVHIAHNCLQNAVQYKGPDIRVYGFGSVLNGLMLKDSDLDVYMMSVANERNEPPIIYNRILRSLRDSRSFTNLYPIREARVPIIKCKHLGTGISIDVNCSCSTSVNNSLFLRDLLSSDKRLHDMMLFLKIWAKNLFIIGHANVKSYCLATLVLFYLQQPQKFNAMRPIVPSIAELQKNMEPVFVDGINYAYDKSRIVYPILEEVQTVTLIKGFFKFYKDFDMSKFIVATYLGKPIPKEAFKTGQYKYEDYDRFRQMNRDYLSRYGEQIEELDIDRCIVLQDPFQLNVNVARGVCLANLEYLHTCIEYADNICDKADNEQMTEAWLYRALLVDVIHKITTTTNTGPSTIQMKSNLNAPSTAISVPSTVQLKNKVNLASAPNQSAATAPSTVQVKNNASVASITTVSAATAPSSVIKMTKDVNLAVTSTQRPIEINTRNALNHRLIPSRTEIRLLKDRVFCCVEDTNYFDKWLQLYNEVITEFMTEVCKIEMIPITEPHASQNQMDSESGTSASNKNMGNVFMWKIRCYIDMWEGRNYPLGSDKETFMEKQLKQTERFLKERENQKKFEINSQGILIIKYSRDPLAMDVYLKKEPPQIAALSKKDPLRKFFGSLKMALQSFNLKEKIFRNPE